MLSFTKPTFNQDGEEIAPAVETTPEVPGAGPAVDAAAPEVSPLFAKSDKAPASATVEAAYDPAVRGQIQRVRLDLLSRETERLEQQLRQVLEQQNEDRQLREELRGQIANLNQRLESLLAGGTAKSAESGAADGDLRTAVKPLLQAVMQMLDSAEAADSADPLPSAAPSETWAQVDAARQAPLPSTTASSEPEAPVEQAPPASQADTADTMGKAGVPDTPEAETAPATAADPEEDLDLDPEAELRIEIARLLRPKKAGGGYEPLARQTQRPKAESKPVLSSPMAEPTEVEPEPTPSSHTTAHGLEPKPLLLGTDETPEVDDAPRSKSHVTGVAKTGAVGSAQASRRGDGPGSIADGRKDSSDGPKADPAQGDLRGGGAVPKSQRPSWAPRPNPMRASLPKCLTEPWEEPSRRPGGRWPFRRTRPAAGRDDPTE